VKLHNLYSSPNIIKVIKSRRWVEHVACLAQMRNAYKIWVRKPQPRWEGSIKMDL